MEILIWIAVIIGVICLAFYLFVQMIIWACGDAEAQLLAKTKRRYNDIEYMYFDYIHKMWFYKPGYPKTQETQ